MFYTVYIGESAVKNREESAICLILDKLLD